MRKLKIYTAACLHHAQMLCDLQSAWDEFEFTASWPNLILSGKDDKTTSEEEFKAIWLMNYKDVLKADVTFIFANTSDTLRGALVEAGIALGAGKRVFLCGQNDFFGNWQFHEGVYRASNLGSARRMLTYISKTL